MSNLLSQPHGELYSYIGVTSTQPFQWEVCSKESVVAFAFLAVKFEHWIQIIDLLEVTF